MRTKVCTATWGAVALAALSWAAAGYAQETGAPPRARPQFGRGFGPGWPGPGGPGLVGRAEELGLSDAQKSQVEVLRKKQRATLQPLMESARQAHEAFRATLDADSPDAATVGQAALAMKAAEKEVRAAHEAAVEEVKAILTPEQRQKLDEVGERGPRRPRGPRP